MIAQSLYLMGESTKWGIMPHHLRFTDLERSGRAKYTLIIRGEW
jgi:hypothetical protein